MFHALQVMSLALVTASPMPAVPAESGANSGQETFVGAGFEVVVDPATGRIIDNPEPFQLEHRSGDVERRRRRSSWDLRVFYLAGGGRGIELDGWADHSLTVEVAADGTMRLGCSQGDEHDRAGGHNRVEVQDGERKAVDR